MKKCLNVRYAGIAHLQKHMLQTQSHKQDYFVVKTHLRRWTVRRGRPHLEYSAHDAGVLRYCSWEVHESKKALNLAGDIWTIGEKDRACIPRMYCKDIEVIVKQFKKMPLSFCKWTYNSAIWMWLNTENKDWSDFYAWFDILNMWDIALLQTQLQLTHTHRHTYAYIHAHTYMYTGKPCQLRTMIFDLLNEDVRVRRTTGNCGTLCV